jgi:DNA-directed RNA polymerase subunit beta'
MDNALNHEAQNRVIQGTIVNIIKNSFPIKSKNKQLDLIDLHMDDTLENNDFPNQKEAKLNRKSWQVPLLASFKLTDIETGKTVDKRENIRIGYIPKLTNRFTVILDGNEYQTTNQIRRKPGIYARVKANGELENEFNLFPGYNFKMQLDPISHIFYVIFDNRKHRLWTLLNTLGVTDDKITEAWGAKLVEINKKGAINTEVSEMTNIYKKLYKKVPKDHNEVIEGLQKYFGSYAKVDPEVIEITLGEKKEHVNGDLLLKSSVKLLDIEKGKKEPDDRDSLLFKQIYSVDDLLVAHFEKQNEVITKKLVRNISLKDKVREIISSTTFGKPVKSFFTDSDLSATPPQTNPVTILGDWRKTSPMGTGGIGSMHAVTMETRNVHPTHLGFLDSLATPECYDKDTQIFTKSGWKYVSEVCSTDLIACNIDGTLEFHSPVKVFKHEYNGLMYGHNGHRLNYLVSKGHNVWAKKYYTQDAEYELYKVEDIFDSKLKHTLVTKPYKGDFTHTHFTLPETDIKIDINIWSEFIGWFISEGCVTHYQNGTTSVQISQVKENNPRKWERLSNLLTQLPFAFHHYERYFFDNLTTELHRYLENFGTYANNKKIPEFYFSLPIEARTKLLDGLLEGDGRRIDPRYNKTLPFNQDVYTTSSETLAKDVERLIISLGYAATVNSYVDKRSDSYFDVYEVRILDFTEAVANKESYYTTDSDGHVYSVQVPGGLVYTKRNGSWAHWSGNSGKVGITLGLSLDTLKQGRNIKTLVINKEGKKTYITPKTFYFSKVGFPDQYKIVNGKVKAITAKVKIYQEGQTKQVAPKDVDYYLFSAASMFSIPTNLVPFIENTQGNRASMGGRMIQQALPLIDREAPLVQTKMGEDSTFEEFAGGFLDPILGEDTDKDGKVIKPTGVVTKVTEDYVFIKQDTDGKIVKRGLYKDFPLNQEGYLNSTPLVEEGDKVKWNTPLADNNYNDSGTLAIGKNLTVAFMPWKGYNFEDGAVITESAAKKLSHSALHKKNLFITPAKTQFDITKFIAWYPGILTADNKEKLADTGLPKKGAKFAPGELLVAILEERELSEEEKIIRKLSKATMAPFVKKVLEWDEEEEGEVIDVRQNGRNIDIYIKSVHPFKEGDKLCVDESTEFLTDSGWKFLTELSLDDNLCTLNPMTHEIEYECPEQINLYDHDGDVYHIESTLIDQMVTLNHKMYVKKRYSKNYELLKAKSIQGKRVRYLKNGAWKGKTNIVPQALKEHMDDFEYAALMGWYLSEGNTNKTSNGYVTTIHQSKEINPQKYDEIAKVIKSCDLTPIYRPDRLVFNGKTIHNYLKQFGHSYQKFVPKEIKEASSDIIKEFLDAYNKGDGHLTKTGQSVITTSSITMRDDLMELWLKAGYSATYKLSAEKGSLICGNPVNHDIWNIRQIRTKNSPQVNHGHIHTQNGQIEEIIHYQGKVGCPTTNNGIVYVRRNGKTSWTGNSGRFGNKSIITKIITDSDAPHRADGKPVDIMLNPHGIPGRMNIGQILETAAGKIAEKTGKPYIVKSFSGDDNSAKIYAEMKKLNIKPNEKLTNGATGKPFEKNIFVGKQYFMKLRHIVKKKAGEHSFGSYDINELPVGKGAQKIDPMLTYSMLAHGTKNLLKEMSTIKGRKNDEYWRNLQLGLAPPPPEGNFVFDKMISYLKAAGVNVEKKGSKFRIFPLTDDTIKEWSAGELTDPGAMLKGKNLAERKGGLFDREITGGLTGEKWTHINLVKKLPNPMYEGAITKLLDLTEDKFAKVLSGELEYNGKTGVEAISAGLKAISVPAELRRLRAELKKAPESNVNKLNSKVRYLEALKDLKYTPEQAYMTKLVPVLPPIYRPIYPLPSGDLMVSDVNQHYRDIGVINTNYKAIKSKLSKEDQRQYDYSLYSAVKAQQGFIDPLTYSQKKYKGVIKELTGKQVKHGFVHSTTWGRRQELSARSTITVEPDLGIDEVGIPKNMAKTIFQPFIIKELVRQGMRAGKALQEVNDNSPLAQKALELIVKDRPVLLNRAPSLHKHSIQAFKPILVDGKAIKLNPIIFGGFNADLDGDTMAVHVPVGTEAVTEAYKILPSNIIFKHGDNSVVPEISQEYIVGLYYLSALGKDTGKSFKSISEAKAAGLHPTDVFKLHGKKMTVGQYEINKVLPASMRDYTRQMNKKAVGKLFSKIGKSYRSDFGKVANRFKDLGNTYAHKRSHTISITDFVQDKSYRNKLYEKELPKIDLLKGTAKVNAYIDLTGKVEKAQDKALAKKNNIYEMIESGSVGGGKKGNVRQILSMPGVVQDLDGNPIPVPILKSYGEGIDTASYWNHIYGVRRGTVDRAVNTADSGALNKALLGVTRRLLVTTKDCKTHEGIELSVDSKDVMDRHLSESIKGVAKKNELVDSRILLKMKASGVKTVQVRSPLTCKAANGVCQLCYGLMPNGQLPALGENIGVIESQALTERSTQLVMRTFHTGGAASGASGGVTEGFPRLVQLLEVPKKLKNKAILSPVKGKVKSIRKNVIGGYDVRIEGYGTKNDQTITVPSSRNVAVKIGAKVSPGDSLSDGSIKPQELAEYKGHLAAQQYIVNQINSIYEDDFYKKGLETVIRGISDNAEVMEAPSSSGFLRGDKTTISHLDKINKDRAKENLDTVKYKPYFKSIETLNVDSEDWLTRFYTNRIKAAIQEGASKAVYGDIAGKDPIPAYIYGDEFGDKK